MDYPIRDEIPPSEMRAGRFADRVRRMVLHILGEQKVPRVVWGTVSAKVAGSPPRYSFTVEGAAAPMAGKLPYLGANAPANGETVGGLAVGTNWFLLWRQTGTS